MSELGKKLKTARLEKGWSLDELQKRTKIQKRYLEAIEDGNFSQMPGDFYARAFVKTYAEAVGLNSAEIFSDYEEELPRPEKPEASELPRRADRPRSVGRGRPNTSSSLLPTLLGIGCILIVGLAVWFFNQNPETDPGMVSNEPSNNGVEIDEMPEENENDETAEENSTVDENENGRLNFSEQQENRYYYSYSGTEEWEIDLVFSGNSWLQIMDEEGEEIHQQEHAEGEEFSLNLNQQDVVTFNLGNARTAQIYFNGEELDYVSDETRKYVIVERVSP